MSISYPLTLPPPINPNLTLPNQPTYHPTGRFLQKCRRSWLHTSGRLLLRSPLQPPLKIRQGVQIGVHARGEGRSRAEAQADRTGHVVPIARFWHHCRRYLGGSLLLRDQGESRTFFLNPKKLKRFKYYEFLFSRILWLISQVDGFFEAREMPSNYTARNITVTVETIVRGLVYLCSFIFGANSLGMIGLGLRLITNPELGSCFLSDDTLEYVRIVLDIQTSKVIMTSSPELCVCINLHACTLFDHIRQPGDARHPRAHARGDQGPGPQENLSLPDELCTQLARSQLLHRNRKDRRR